MCSSCNPTRKRLFFTIFFGVVDLALCGALLWSTSRGEEKPWWTSSEAFFDQLLAFDRNATVDVAFLVLLRILYTTAGGFFALRLPNAKKPHTSLAARTSLQQPLASVLTEPLLDEVKVDSSDTAPPAPIAFKGILGPDGGGINQSIAARQAVIIGKSQLATTQRYKALAVIFFLTTATSVYIGVKCVVYSFKNPTLDGSLIALTVVIMHAEYFMLQAFLEKAVEEKGRFFKGAHHHPLYLKKLVCHWCDLCHKKIKEKQGWNCDPCGFDICNSCAVKNDKGRAEGVVRGDAGVKEEKEVTSMQYFCRAMSLSKPYLGILSLSLLCLLVNSAAALVLPNYTGLILDSVAERKQDEFWDAVKVFSISSAVVGAFGAVRNLCVSIIGRRISNDVRNQLFKSIIVQDVAFFDSMMTGQLTARLTNDANAMVSPISTIINTLTANALLLLGGLFMCLYTSWRLSMLAFTSIGPIIYITAIYAKWSRQINWQIWSALGDANSVATEAFSNIRTVRAFGREITEMKKFATSTGTALANGIKDAFAGAGTFCLTSYLDLGAGVLILCYGGFVAITAPERLSVGKLITFQLYWQMITNSYQALAGVLSSLTQAGGAATRVIQLLESLPDIDPNAGLFLTQEQLKGQLALEDVQFHYQMRPDNKVLKGVDLLVQPGQVCALVGKSGGGKSTLVHLLMRFYDPRGGRIMLDGVDLRDVNSGSLRRHVGLVAQETQLFNRTIEENIAYGLEAYTAEEVEDAAKEANAFDFIMEFEEGFQTKVGERGTRLSGGQKQRIALARCFLRKPKLLFLDEATSALDTESEALVQAAIDKLISRGGCTVVLVAHRLSTVINADVIGVVHEGRVLEQGSHDELVARDGVYRRLVAAQLAKKNNEIDDSHEEGEDGDKKKSSSIDALFDEVLPAAADEGVAPDPASE